MKVIKEPDDKGNYVVQNLVTQTPTTYHVSKLRPFLYDERTLTPLQVAVTDTLDEFLPEKVLDMRGDTHGKRKFLQFKIRWAGYGPETDTWESWDNCKGTDAVQLYLSEHPNKRVRKLCNKDYVPPHLRSEETLSDNDDNKNTK